MFFFLKAHLISLIRYLVINILAIHRKDICSSPADLIKKNHSYIKIYYIYYEKIMQLLITFFGFLFQKRSKSFNFLL